MPESSASLIPLSLGGSSRPCSAFRRKDVSLRPGSWVGPPTATSAGSPMFSPDASVAASTTTRASGSAAPTPSAIASAIDRVSPNQLSDTTATSTALTLPNLGLRPNPEQCHRSRDGPGRPDAAMALY
jgi:hypothetical protein